MGGRHDGSTVGLGSDEGTLLAGPRHHDNAPRLSPLPHSTHAERAQWLPSEYSSLACAAPQPPASRSSLQDASCSAGTSTRHGSVVIAHASIRPRRSADPNRRLAATESASQSQAQEILAKQRLNRPVSPHLSIYKPQITWYASSLNRITGVTLSGALYLFGIAYLAAPTLGWHLETQSMVAAVAAWPLAVKLGLKSFFAFPFFFHSYNGLRHLSWDLGLGLKNTQVIRTGWTVVGLTVATSLYYVFFQ